MHECFDQTRYHVLAKYCKDNDIAVSKRTVTADIVKFEVSPTDPLYDEEDLRAVVCLRVGNAPLYQVYKIIARPTESESFDGQGNAILATAYLF